MSQVCSKTTECDLFGGSLDLPEDTALIYKCRYCLSGDSIWEACRRFVLLDTRGYCPEFVMPNSLLSMDQILSRMEKLVCVLR